MAICTVGYINPFAFSIWIALASENKKEGKKYENY